MEKSNEKKQTLCLRDRKVIELDGVSSVISLTDEYLDVATVAGDVSIEGESLKIQELCRENGKIIITGEINAIIYDSPKAKKGLFGSLFK